jgi:endogenous inhibitor of DNA gyrase (YacG/DUF329 family)
MTDKHTRERLLAIVDECDTEREAARRLGTYEEYIYVLTRRCGITKWRQKNRTLKSIKTVNKICEECGEMFTRETRYNNRPCRFCSKKCQGHWLGKTYGFKKKG